MTRVAIAVLLAALCTSAAAEQIRYLPDAPGVWKPWVFRAYGDNRTRVGAKPPDLEALEGQLLALSAILERTPGFAAPVGFSVEAVGELDLGSFHPGQPAPTTLPLPATLNFGAYGIHEFERNGKVVREDGGETAQLLFFVNQLAVPLFFGQDDIPEFEDVETDVTRLAGSQPDLLGMPRYGDTLVLKKNPAPIWSAVPLGETLELTARGIARRLATAREQAARLRGQYDDLRNPAKRAQRIAEYKTLAGLSKDPGYLDKMLKVEAQMESGAATLLGPIDQAEKQVAAVERDLDTAKSTLAALSSAERAVPACYAAQEAVSLSRFRGPPDGGCVAIVRPNWTLFDPALPRSAPQLLVIAHFERCLAPSQPQVHAGGCTANRRLLETIDQPAVLAWLQ